MNDETILENRRKAVEHLRHTNAPQAFGILFDESTGHACAVGHIGMATGVPTEKLIHGDYEAVYDTVGIAKADPLGDVIWEWNDGACPDGKRLTLREIGNKLAEAWNL